MYIGLREEFEYIECVECGCLQIMDYPENMSSYYDAYEYKEPGYFNNIIRDIRKYVKGKLITYHFNHQSHIGRILSHRFKIPSFYALINEYCEFNSNILDIGCGMGDLLVDLYNMGYENLYGLDPFVNFTLPGNSKYHFLTGFLGDVVQKMPEQFDFIMFNHSFEHLPEPKNVFKDMFQLLQPGGYALIRTPIAGSYAWRTYRSDWVQLDAPRHFCIPTEKGVRILSEGMFELVRIVYDSTAFQFTGSERYRRGIPLKENQRRLFGDQEIQAYESRAKELNLQGDGDQACIVLYKPIN